MQKASIVIFPAITYPDIQTDRQTDKPKGIVERLIYVKYLAVHPLLDFK